MFIDHNIGIVIDFYVRRKVLNKNIFCGIRNQMNIMEMI